MPVKYIPYFPDTIEGQAILNNFVRTRRALKYRDNDKVLTKLKRGMPYYEVEKVENIGSNPKNMLIRGESISACAYLKEKGIKVDLVYIDPPFASGADYAKKVYIRRNPKVAGAIKKAEEEMDIEELRSFEEKMYGDIWNKEAYLSWMYENLMAIKSVMSETASIYVHLDWHIGHYVKVLMDEVFGEDNFRNEIVWCYSGGAVPVDRFPKKHDAIYWYSKSNTEWLYIPEYRDYSEKTQQRGRTQVKGYDAKLREEGTPINDWWADISPVTSPTDYEKMYYATQKPEALLNRIVKASSNKGMLVADFFGGSGVTAKVANDLNRNFIHCDVGANSIQTTRDRLKSAEAEFDILEIKDGVNLFRNPVQTMDKLKKMILGLRNEDNLDKFWEGAIQDSKLGTIPVYLPNLLDHTTKVLDIPLMNLVINEAIPDLPDEVKKVIVYYIDIDDQKELEKFIREQNILVEIELRDLKQLLDETVADDIVEYTLTCHSDLIKEPKGTLALFQHDDKEVRYEIEITKFISDRLRQKIEEYNQKGLMQPFISIEKDNDENGNGENKENIKVKKKKFTPIEISKDGLELIELISLDCTNKAGIWKSDKEIKIDKLGLTIEDGKKTKTFWDAKITCNKKPLRLKVRNIAGDDVVLNIEGQSTKEND